MQDFRNFSDDKLHTLFSKGRIVSYDSVNQHFDNFRLIASISENLGIAEILLRNKIDSLMCGLDSAWLDNVPSKIEIDKPKNEPNPTHDKLVSMQSIIRLRVRFLIKRFWTVWTSSDIMRKM